MKNHRIYAKKFHKFMNVEKIVKTIKRNLFYVIDNKIYYVIIEGV